MSGTKGTKDCSQLVSKIPSSLIPISLCGRVLGFGIVGLSLSIHVSYTILLKNITPKKMASISTYALGLFEIVENILSLVDSPKTLYACARVNKMWSDDSLKRMWKGSVRDEKWRTPSMAVLRRMASVSLERLRWYLNAVRHLAIKNDDSVYIASSISNHLFYDTIFKSATPFSVAVDIGLPLMTEAFMTQLLQPKLRRLELCRGHFSDRFFDPIRVSTTAVHL